MMCEWNPVAKVYDALKAGSIDGTDVEPHDKAVWRAMLSRYRPNKGVTGDPHLTLFVARLNPQTSEEKLQEVFSKFGDVRRVRLVRDIVTGFSKRYAFVEYKEERSVKRAWRDANKLVVDQYELFVDFELERTLQGWVPRRFGGGQGGQKESGQLRFGGRDRPFRKPINLTSMMPQNRSADRWEGASARDAVQEQDREHGRWRERERGNDRGFHKDKRDHKRHRDRSRERDSNRREDRRRRDTHRDYE
ncbi:U11/U12 small nuclear ribonucleoprotein 35 kDa protein [Triplophysa tibetana]|uniref:U11/U12 small nuclear ribonucleoprotein 35 kDa protein n=1 Tax=Triplophysa tibetana TaxID=1572043 RepID=A0A5A9N2H0_9TELE|nr:U11/U12 small nuclear ribonucleoprotein 35 kDa protein [Triplophysa tibetana]